MSYDPFSVRIGKSETIDDLKEAIKKRMENAFSGVDSYLLNLWKVSIFSGFVMIRRFDLWAVILTH